MHLIEKQNLKNYNTFGMEVVTKSFLQVDSAEEVPYIIENYLQRHPYYLLGGGSNTLFTKDFDGIIVHPAFSGIGLVGQRGGEAVVRVAAGEQWDNLVQYCIRREYYGLENLTGIPGLVGSAPVQNIGAYGVELKDTLLKVEGYRISTGEAFELTRDECQFGYRNSIFKQKLKNDCFITYVWFRLSCIRHFTMTYQGLSKVLEERELPLTLRNVSECVRTIRDTKLPNPAVVGNGGSFFKNPVVTAERYEALVSAFPDLVAYDAPDGKKKLSAGQLIEKAGWKGRRVGNAGTWENQALVLVNYGGATPDEVLHVADSIVDDVNRLFNIVLEMEINRI